MVNRNNNQGTATKIPTYRIQKDEIKVHNLADIHYGSSACLRTEFERLVASIKNDNNSYWISTGDILDCNTSKGKFYDSSGMDVNDEMNEVVNLLRPISYKCLGFVSSNHPGRVRKLSDVDLDMMFATALKIPYLGDIGMVCVKVGSPDKRIKPIYIALHHGSANGTSIAAKALSIEKLRKCLPGADIYMEGHSHTFHQWSEQTNDIDRRHDVLTSYPQLFCGAPHLLDWATSYGSGHKYLPTPPGVCVLDLTNYSCPKVSLIPCTDSLFKSDKKKREC